MHEHALLGLMAIVTLGVGAQWIAWRLRLPSILLLLLFGFLAGPVARQLGQVALEPDELFGELLLPLVSLSVAIILYEGGLSLNRRELPKVGSVVRNLVSIGMLVTWVLASVAAHWCFHLAWPVALLLGAVLVVSGPTVIIPLLRHVRPAGVVGPVVKWEGIVIDPLGATLAVLVFEGALTAAAADGKWTLTPMLLSLLRTAIVGGGLGVVAGFALAYLMRRHWVPDYLHNAVSLLLVTAGFTTANLVQQEAGLLTVTTMGLVLANQRIANVRHIIDFKENLRVLLISMLFILLAARLRFEDLTQLGVGTVWFIAALILVIRPLAVALSCIRSELTWRERLFLAAMAPRGIVAAAVASVFALRLESVYPEARLLVPITFVVIIATVACYGLASVPLARWLGLADTNPQGLLIVGAHPWARALGEVLQREGVRVQLLDRNRGNVSVARLAGLPAYEGNVLGEYVLDELDLRGIGRLLALTPNDEVNALAAQRFTPVFERAGVFQLPPAQIRKGEKTVPQEMHGQLLFSADLTYADLSERYNARGYVFRATNLTEDFDYDAFRQRYGESVLPLFVLRSSGAVTVVTARGDVRPRPGDTVVSLGPDGDRVEANRAERARKVNAEAAAARDANA